MVSSHDISHMDHMVIFGGSELLSPDSSTEDFRMVEGVRAKGQSLH